MKVQHVGAKVLALAIFGVVTLMGALYLYSAAGGKNPLSSRYSAQVVVPDAFQLVNNSDVKRAGVNIGKVTGITNRGVAGVVTLSIDDEHAPLYRNATAQVRSKSLLGENYLEVVPGTPSAGKLPTGQVLPVERAKEAVPLDRILGALDAKTRRALTADLRGLGAGVDGRGGDLNRLFAAAAPTVSRGGRVASVLNADRAAVARLIDHAGTAMAAVGRREQQVQTLIRSAKTTAEAVAARDEQLRQTFAELPPTMRQARGSLATLAGFSRRATPVVATLDDAVRRLGPVVSDLRPTAVDARALVRDLPRFMAVADPMLKQLTSFSTAVRPVLDPLDASLREINPALEFIAPYYRELGSTLANMGSAFNHDRYGHFGHVFPLVSPASAAVWSPAMKDAFDALLEAGVVGEAFKPQNNAYPKPGTMAEPEPFDGRYPRVQAAGK